MARGIVFKMVIRIQEEEFKKFKENIDYYINEGMGQLDYARRQFLEGFVDTKESIDNLEEDEAKKAEDFYYVVLYSLIKNPNLIPMIPQAELDRLNVKTFGDYLGVIRSWGKEIKRSNKYSERLVTSYSKLPKLVLYPTFVISLMGMFWHAMNGYSMYRLGFSFSSIALTHAIIIVYALASWFFGRGIYRKIESK